MTKSATKPVKVNDDLYALPLATEMMNGPTLLNPALILDEQHGPTLVDTGVPGQLNALEAALGEIGLKVEDVRRVILTHQDLDHIGSLAEVVRVSGAEVLAHAEDVPYIEGRLPLLKLPPPEQREAMLATLPPQVREVFSQPLTPVKVDQTLEDGERLELGGGVRVIFTPGHTPGHISLYLERSRALISGDALGSSDGQLVGPREQVTPDMAEARASVVKLAKLEVGTVLTYHGGVVEDGGTQLKALAQELVAE